MLLTNEEELKRINVTSISEQAEKFCGELKNFYGKKLLPSQVIEPTAGKLTGC